MLEILAPAGGKESALAAINHGADAIYLALKQFSARSSAENFDKDSFKEILDYAHLFGVKVHVAMNTLIKESELFDYLQQIVEVWNLGCDAFIVSDIFLGKLIKEQCPDIVLHLSTQAGVCNEYGAALAKSYGFSRVVLARETPISEIRKITKIIETEVFVQGALCTCFSGQCYMSSFAGGNSGNRGKCKQPCRKLYSIDRQNCIEKSYKLSLSDLCVGEKIFDLIDSGVTSFKIEGRMRRAEYVAAAVDYYRSILDGENDKNKLSALKRTFNRGNYTQSLAYGQSKNFISSQVQGHIGEYVGMVKVINGTYICQTNERFSKNDGFKILRDGKEVGGAWFVENTNTGFVLQSKTKLRNADKIFITTDNQLFERLLSLNRKLKIKVSASFKIGSVAEIMINDKKFNSDFVLEKADKRALTSDELIKNLQKIDVYPFEISFDKIECDEVFVPISQLNLFRRQAYNDFFKDLTQTKNTQYSSICVPKFEKINVTKTKTAVILTDLSTVNAEIGILKINNFEADIVALTKNFKNEKFLYVPPFFTFEDGERFKQIAQCYDGIYSDGIGGVNLSKSLGKKFFAGFGFNISNSVDLALCDADYVCISKELTVKEASSLSTEKTFYLTQGDIKIMDLIYCPFEKKCRECDKRSLYNLTDENKRNFPLRRYETSECRFELYNCATLVCDPIKNLNSFIDCSISDPKTVLSGAIKSNNVTKITRGHSQTETN